MAERRRKQASTNSDDEDYGSPLRQAKKRRLQRPQQNNSPVIDEQVENDENAQPSTANEETEDLLQLKIPDRPEPAMSTDPNAPRLIITRIDVENFKSYYGKQVLGPFHKNFTSILGPNGSGKSNVIDSLLFVFGFRANRLRSKKISVLIHNSSAHPDIRSCTVAVHFAKILDKGTTHEIQPGSEFCISRTATKSGNSTYYINHRSSTTDEVRNMLKSNGIDLDHNRFLILQGEVEQISLMKPKRSERGDEDGMLEYLEDIIGSSRLKVPIERFKKRIDFYINEEDMIQKRLKLANTEVDALIEPVREIIRLMRVENAITKCKHKLLSIDKFHYIEKSNQAKARFDELKQQHGEVRKALTSCNSEIKKLQTKQAKLTEEESSLWEKIDDADKRKKDSEMEQRKITEDITRLENRKVKKEHEIKTERRKLEEAELTPSQSEKAIRECQATIERLTAEIAEDEARIKDLGVKERKANEATRTELSQIMPQITKLSTEENNWAQRITVAKDRLERLLDSANDPQNQVKIAENKSKSIESELAECQRKLEQLTSNKPVMSNELRSQEEAYQRMRHRESELTDQISSLQREIESHRSEVNSSNSNSTALLALMREKQSGRIEGVLGRLGDLGGIDPRYDVAISTCCPQLENVVVDTVETAQECIRYLKDNSLPRMTFIALDKQDHLWDAIQNKPRTPDDAPRIFDLIKVSNENVKPAFYSVLRDTLFAENIEDATRISGQRDTKRWRVVTARGEVVEPSGTMTGGGRKEIRGRMGKQVRVDTLQVNNEHDWKKMEQQVKELREEQTSLRRELSKTMDQIRYLKEDYARLEQEERMLSQNIPKIRRQFDLSVQAVNVAKEAVQVANFDENEISELRNQIAEFEKEKQAVYDRASSLRNQKDKLDSEIKKVEDKILGKSRDKLKQLKDKLKSAEDECKQEKLKLKNSSSTIERIRRNIDAIEQFICATLEDLKKAQMRITYLKKDFEAQIARKAEYDEALSKNKALVAETKEALETLNEKETQLQQEMEAKKSEFVVAETHIANFLEKLNEVEADIGKLSLFTVRAGICLPAVQASSAARNLNAANAEAETVQQEAGDAQEGPSVLEVTKTDNNTQEEGNETAEADLDATETNSEAMETNAEAVEADAEASETGAEAVEANAEEIEANAEAVQNGLDIDEQTEELPNTTTITDFENNVTHNPAYDMGTLPCLTNEEIQDFSRDEIRLQLQVHEKRKSKFKVKMNMALIDEYAEKMERRAEVESEMEKLKQVLTSYRKKWLELTQQRNDEFNDGFQKIYLATQEIYQMITLGGDAILEKVNAMDTFNEGITFQVRPPKKTWKQITNLSGGEKTLASLALVFGLHTFRPTPLYVMDEIDAALDYRNVSIISTYLKERTKNAQFIIISLRNNMFENADRLLGIYKVKDCTHNVVYDTQFQDNTDTEEEDHD